MKGPRGSARGLTVVEVLVATALFALLTTATSSVWLSALRMTAAAEEAAERRRLLEPYSLPVSLPTRPPPACAEGPGPVQEGDPSPCLEAATRCRAGAGEIRCGDGGDLMRFDLRLPASLRPGAPATERRVALWARVPP